MQYLSLEKVSKRFGEKELFNDIDLVISKGDKLALIARNGSGKSTLLKVIAGKEAPEGERAKVFLNTQIKSSYLEQNPLYESSRSIMEICSDIDHPAFEAHRQYVQAMSAGNDQLLQSAMEKVEELKAWEINSRIKEVLFKLGLTKVDQPCNTLSGGEQKRLSLAQVILSEPDFLILDEPTNHLDTEMIEWLEKYLQQSNLSVFMVTHDRYFLERICNQMIELDKGSIQIYHGNYSDYLAKKAELTEHAERSISKAKKLLTQELTWINRQPKARGTKSKSRINKFYELKEKVNSATYENSFEIDIEMSRLGSKILECHEINLKIGDKHIIKNFNYKFKKGDKVGIAGPNGSGKSSFVELIAGINPNFDGSIVRGDTLKIGYYKQKGHNFDLNKNVIEIIRDIAEYIPLKKGQKLSASKLLENFMFSPDQQQVRIDQLSGGELKRLQLICVLLSNPNFLILDEPTNDLDLLTLQVLEDYLQSFPGCLVLISHDRFFLDRLVDHTFVMAGDGAIKDFNGGYSEWKTAQSNAEKDKNIASPTKITRQHTDDASDKKQLKKEIKKIERNIDNLEKRKSELLDFFENPSLSPEEIKLASKELSSIESELEEWESKWMMLVDQQ